MMAKLTTEDLIDKKKIICKCFYALVRIYYSEIQ